MLLRKKSPSSLAPPSEFDKIKSACRQTGLTDGLSSVLSSELCASGNCQYVDSGDCHFWQLSGILQACQKRDSGWYPCPSSIPSTRLCWRQYLIFFKSGSCSAFLGVRRAWKHLLQIFLPFVFLQSGHLHGQRTCTQSKQNIGRALKWPNWQRLGGVVPKHQNVLVWTEDQVQTSHPGSHPTRGTRLEEGELRLTYPSFLFHFVYFYRLKQAHLAMHVYCLNLFPGWVAVSDPLHSLFVLDFAPTFPAV